jgi:hypothetical protein
MLKASLPPVHVSKQPLQAFSHSFSGLGFAQGCGAQVEEVAFAFYRIPQSFVVVVQSERFRDLPAQFRVLYALSA